MSRNRIISSALLLCNVIIAFIVLLFVSYTFILLHSMASPESYGSVVISNGSSAGYQVGNIKICEACTSTPTDLRLVGLTFEIRLWLIFRTALFSIVTILVIRRFKLVLRSVDQFKTFYDSNILNFQQLTKLGVVLVIFSSFNFSSTTLNFTIPFGLLAFSLGCKVLAEIFKEGAILLNDKKSIV